VPTPDVDVAASEFELIQLNNRLSEHNFLSLNAHLGDPGTEDVIVDRSSGDVDCINGLL
jgi:hypothetical protein